MVVKMLFFKASQGIMYLAKSRKYRGIFVIIVEVLLVSHKS